jgi:hypothetical protein
LTTFTHLWWAAVAIGAGVLAAVPMLVRRRAALRSDAAAIAIPAPSSAVSDTTGSDTTSSDTTVTHD